MFELSVEAAFSAEHALTIAGRREPMHGHDFHVTLTVAGGALDPDGLLCDFHTLDEVLRAVLAPLHGRCLNDTPPFDRVSPSAERIARYIADAVAPRLPAGVRVESVRVTEAPGCAAVYRP